jgi:hypothetical protein
MKYWISHSIISLEHRTEGERKSETDRLTDWRFFFISVSKDMSQLAKTSKFLCGIVVDLWCF